MEPIIDYILNNKEWIFSGIGIFVLSGIFWFVRRLLFLNSPRIDVASKDQLRGANRHKTNEHHKPTISEEQGDGSNGAANVVPNPNS